MSYGLTEEINRAYIPAPPGIRPPPGSRSLLRSIPPQLARLGTRFLSALARHTTGLVRLSLLPFLFVAALLIATYLQAYLLRRAGRRSTVHLKALDNIDSFLRQYPLHLYPLVAKSLELAYIQEELPHLLRNCDQVLEMGIGDGTLSARIFPPTMGITALELNPYLLFAARRFGHVRKAVVCHCLFPPVREGGFDLIVANNVVHHVSQKADLLARWARIAEHALFNENTVFWASSWVGTYLLRKLGLRTAASRVSARIAQRHWQSVLAREDLHEIVRSQYEVIRAESYLSQRTFFMCAIFSALMLCTGPPTPPILKRVFLGASEGIVLSLTKRIASLLIRFDVHQDRSKDAFVSYTCKSREFRRSPEGPRLMCPDCKTALAPTNKCVGCGVHYQTSDGMLFLLPREIDHIRQAYSPEFAATIPGELV